MIKRIRNRLKHEFLDHRSNVFRKFVQIRDELTLVKHNSIKCTDKFSYEPKSYSYFGDNPYWTQIEDILDREQFYFRISNAKIINKGIVVDNSNKVVLESTIFQEEYLEKLDAFHEIVLNQFYPTIKMDKVISLSNYLDGNYFHFIAETIPRLLILMQFGLNFKDYTIILSESSYKQAEMVFENFLKIPKEQIFRKKHKQIIQAEEVIVPSFTHSRSKESKMANIYNQSLFQYLNNLALKYSKPEKKKNLLVVRNNVKQRRFSDFHKLDSIIAKYQFEVIDLAKLDFKQQLHYFRNANLVLAIHGAGLTNLLFSESAKIIELFPTSRWCRDAFYYYQISNALNHSHHVHSYEQVNKSQDFLVTDDWLVKIEESITILLNEQLSNPIE